MNNIIESFDFCEHLVKGLYFKKHFVNYDKTISKSINRRNMKENLIFGGEMIGSCIRGLSSENAVVMKNTQLLIGSKNIYIIGSPVLGNYKKDEKTFKRITISNTISLLNGYNFINKNV
jgi:hypothetical protein